MNRERAKELLPIIQAFSDGEEIEFCSPENISGPQTEWESVQENPNWHTAYKYRIKPKSREFWITISGIGTPTAHGSKQRAVDWTVGASAPGRSGSGACAVGQPGRLRVAVERSDPAHDPRSRCEPRPSSRIRAPRGDSSVHPRRRVLDQSAVSRRMVRGVGHLGHDAPGR